jgi:hypothetical protein
MTGPRSAACRRALSALPFLLVGRGGRADVVPGFRMRFRVGRPMLVTALGAAAKPAPRLKATEQPIDTSTAAGKCLLDMLGVSRNSRRTFAVSASSRGLPRPRRRLQGPAGFNRCRAGARDEDAGDRGIRDREGPEDRAGVGLSGAGSRLIRPMAGQVAAERMERARVSVTGEVFRQPSNTRQPDSPLNGRKLFWDTTAYRPTAVPFETY